MARGQDQHPQDEESNLSIETEPSTPKRVSRRSLIQASAVVGGTTIAGIAYGSLSDNQSSASRSPALENGPATFGQQTVPMRGNTQAGITTPQQSNLMLISFNVKDGLEPVDVKRLLKVLSHDAERLTQGKGGVADVDYELAALPANLTITFGVGPDFFKKFGIPQAQPQWLKQLPPYRIDQLQDSWNGGDFVIQLCGDDQLAISHARRQLISQTRKWLSVKWLQTGFSGAKKSRPDGTTMRNLMGQVDGTVNPSPEVTPDKVFISDGSSWENGSVMVVRRIAMNLETWEEVDRPAREDSMGRKIVNGAPLSGSSEHDPVDFDAKTPLGFPLVASYSHVRRARSENPAEVIYRRAYNYDDAPGANENHNTGLVFISFQADLEKQYLPVQQRLADLDSMNEWTTPIGSAVFAMLPGLGEDSFIGERLIEPFLQQ